MSKQLQVKQQTAIAPMASGNARGFENFKQEDLVLPRLRLLQGLSEAVVEGHGKIGEFQDSLSGEVLGDSIEIVLLGMKNGAVYFEQGEGLKCKSADGITNMEGTLCVECPYDEYHSKRWDKDTPPPKCSSTKEFICVTRETVKGTEQRPIVVSFLKTSFKEGRKLASIARLSGRDIFAGAYVVTSTKVTNKKGTFAVMDVKQNGWLSPEEFKAAEAWYNTIGSANVVVHEASEQREEIDSDII